MHDTVAVGSPLRRVHKPALAAGLVLVVAVGVFVATRGDDGPAAGEPVLLGGVIPVRDNVVQPPGTELGGGFIVADGSHLLGATVPYLFYDDGHGDRSEDDGWQAVLLVDEPGRAVFDRYVDQAEAQGIPILGAVRCEGRDGSLTCSADGGDGTPGRQRSVSFMLHQEPGEGGRPPVSSLVIDFHSMATLPYDPTAFLPREPPRNDEPGQVPAPWPDLPRSGDQFWTDRPHEPFTVKEGSTLLAHSVRVDEVGTATMFEVTDDPESVIDRYVDQSGPETSNEVRTFERDGATLTTDAWSDGGTYVIRIVERPGEPTWMLLVAYPTD